MTSRLLLLSLLFPVLSFPAAAQQPRNEVAVSAGVHEVTGPTALGVAYNRFWFEGVSTRLGVWGSHERTFGSERDFRAWFASAEVHWRRNRRVSPYVGLGIVNAIDRQESRFDRRSDRRSTTTALVSAGADVNFSRRFAVAFETRYLKHDEALLDEERFATTGSPIPLLLSGKFRF